MNDATPQRPEPKPTPAWIHFRWPLAIVLICSIPLVAFMLLLRASKEAVSEGAKTAAAITQGIGDAAERFKKGTITETFVAAIPTMAREAGGNLELATANNTETFRRTDSRSIAWDKVYLGTTVTEIQVPVTYRYHLRLSDPWKIDVSEKTCIVYAPRIRPSLPPAIHTDKMEKRTDVGWARFNAREQMEELEKSITPTLEKYAGDRRHLGLVREECRKTVAEFVQAWLLREDQWRTDRFHSIKVIFEDETIEAENVKPTIEFTLPRG